MHSPNNTIIFSWHKWNKKKIEEKKKSKEAKTKEEIDGRQCILTRRWRDLFVSLCSMHILTGCFESLSSSHLLIADIINIEGFSESKRVNKRHGAPYSRHVQRRLAQKLRETKAKEFNFLWQATTNKLRWFLGSFVLIFKCSFLRCSLFKILFHRLNFERIITSIAWKRKLTSTSF